MPSFCGERLCEFHNDETPFERVSRQRISRANRQSICTVGSSLSVTIIDPNPDQSGIGNWGHCDGAIVLRKLSPNCVYRADS